MKKIMLSDLTMVFAILIMVLGFFFIPKAHAAEYPNVETTEISNTTLTTISVKGEVTYDGGDSGTKRGVCWNSKGAPSLENKDPYKKAGTTGQGVFTVEITGLVPNTTYYLRAYASNSIGISYGTQKSATTETAPPTVTTSEVNSVSTTMAVSGGNVVSDNGFPVTQRGICWNTSGNPTKDGWHTTNGAGTGNFTSWMKQLIPSTTYYVRAYAVNAKGTGYGNELSFNAINFPTVTTRTVSVINATTASGGGTVVSDSGKPVTSRGVCWTTSENPTTADNRTYDGSGTGDFVSSVTGLNPGKKYYLRAYAENEVGTAYGSQVSFSTVSFYVNQRAVGENNGSSWENAYTDLQDALNALPADGSGYEIWVAAGTYKPGSDRSDSFQLKSGVQIYGGFDGTESDRSQRDWETNVTILSGDIGISDNSSDNSYHVITSTDADNTALLNGFAITAGNADGYYSDAQGGGMFNYNSSPVIISCVFTDNSATEGGGMYNDAGSPALADCIFSNNTVNMSGGGIFNNNSNTTITRCTFSDNAANSGAGMCSKAGTLTISNSTFSDNSASYSGGGIYTDKGTLLVTNCTLSNNTADSNDSEFGYGGGLYVEGTGTSVNIINTIIANNFNGFGRPYPDDCFNENGNISSSGYNLVENGCVSDFTKTGDITGEQAGLNLGLLADYGGLTLTCALVSGSPAIDAGNSSQAPGTDQRGYARNGPADIGAFEFKGPAVKTGTISHLTSNSVVCGGNVTSDGGFPVTARGVCWSMSANPTTGDSHTADDKGPGVFTSNISSLSSSTTYYVRAYAENQEGISYGNEISFKTVPDPPIALAATDMTTTGFTANWNETVGAESYRLDLSITGGFTSYVSGYENLAVISKTSQHISGLIPGASYYYRVRAINSGGFSDNSNIIKSVTVPPGPEAKPGTNITTESFTANWSTVIGAESYRLDVSPDENFSSYVAGYENLSVGLGLSLDVRGLVPGVTCYYRVRALNTGGTSENSVNITVRTIPVAPAATDATNKTDNGLTANWTPVEGADDYRLDVSLKNDFSEYVSGYENKTVSGTSHDVTGLLGGITCYYRVRASNTGGVSENSNIITVLTVPRIPVVTEATDIRADSFVANWNPGPSAVSYELDVSVSNEFDSYVTGYENKPVGNTSDTVIGLTGNTVYYYRVRAVNGSGTGENSEVMTVRTGPSAPDATEASDFTATGFTANWDSVPGAETYRLDVSASNDFSSFADGYEDSVVGTGTSQIVTDLEPGTVYHYRVRAVSSVGTSENSDVITCVTIPPMPVLVPASEVTGDSFAANWNPALSAETYFLDVSVSFQFSSYVEGFENLDVGGETSHRVSGLALGTTYYYRVRAENPGGISENSFPGMPVLTLPPAPVTAPASDITSTSFTANWNVTPSTETYRLDVSGAPDFSSHVDGYNDLIVSSRTSQGIIGLSPGGTYYYRVRAVNSGGTSENSDPETVTISSTPPTVITGLVISVTTSAAVGNGEVTNDGGSDITERGVCWSTEMNPSVTGNIAEATSPGTGTYTADITGLEPDTTYYVKAYAGNIAGTAYGDQVSFTTKDFPKVTTAEVSSVTSVSALSGGTVISDGGSPVTARGVCWNTAEDPGTGNSPCTVNGQGTGSYTSSITGLVPGFGYYVRAYAASDMGTAYGNSKSFASDNVPTVATGRASDITSETASLSGRVTDDGGDLVTLRGICWGISEMPGQENGHCTEQGTGTGSFTSPITGLAPNTSYYFRAYAENSVGRSYGKEELFKSSCVPGDVNADGAVNLTDALMALKMLTETETGTVYSGADTNGDKKIGTEDILFILRKILFTVKEIPTVTTAKVTSITSASAVSGGNVTNDGGSPVTARGVCWNTAQDPGTENSLCTADGQGTGSYISSITGLVPGAGYYVRAYAVSDMGTAYGNPESFASDNVPTVVTSGSSDITSSAASLSGEVTDDGGDLVTARGICWNTAGMPGRENGPCTEQGTGTGSFTSPVTGLIPDTSYYFRAYAENSVGISHGNEESFKTLPVVVSPTLKSPNGGEVWCAGDTYSIEWDPGNAGNYVRTVLYKNGNQLLTIKQGMSNNGLYSWEIPESLSQGYDYRIRITDEADTSLSDESNADFSIAENCKLTITAPNGGETWHIGDTNTIQWIPYKTDTMVMLSVFKEAAQILELETENDGIYIWTVPDTLSEGDDYRISIRFHTDSDISDYSDNYFSIKEPSQSLKADAGDDQTVNEKETVFLNGSGSGNAASYLWKQISGISVELSDAASAQASFDAPEVGTDGATLTFQLTVEDNDGLTDTDTCIIQVKEKVTPSVFTNSLGMTFNLIRAGTFIMGSGNGMGMDETPHQVTLTQNFYMQTTEVTQGQWITVAGNNPSHFNICGDECPVENVSWDDVQEFIARMNERGEGTYRLPTEAEWEYAARARTATPFSFGNCLSADQANYDGKNPLDGCPDGEYRETTIAVASFLSNAWGLYDMHGNVWEWCQDWYGNYPTSAVTDPAGPESGSVRVRRGGGWDSFAERCRSAARFNQGTEHEYPYYGFRLALSPRQ